ncbi:MAG: hypothetical protein QF371_03140 [Flavobacteriales bacterium]|jgi:hypothetical protein|nr:hypothetical protein [Flavobacteriales bacterium]
MKTDLAEIQETLRTILKSQIPPLRIRKDNPQTFEVCGTKEAMQGKKKVDGYYFGSVVPKPKDIRLYYFPIYTHVNEFSLSDELKKSLKGKSCFHIKKLSPEMEKEIGEMVMKGVELYQNDELI